jgi:DNA invertase Pin-like site-specific DNA recombinase
MIQDDPTVRGAVPSPTAALRDPKITPRHLAQGALIYVRQSSPTQVQRYPESARRQYGLTERAQRLGWGAEQITIIDDDQGKSAAGSAAAHERDGFARVVAAVGLGEVGLILALEVARLARNSAEWYRLLELAALAGVLIGDEDSIYDPRDFNDRLLLGLRGTISEVGLHCMQARLHGARLSKAHRGEFPLLLPIGYVRGANGQVEGDPDAEVQGALRTIFTQFERLGSASAVLRFFSEHGLRIPRRYGRGPAPHPLVWVKPSYQAIHQVVSNPAYAGAYGYGQSRQESPALPGLGPRGPRRRWALDEALCAADNPTPAAPRLAPLRPHPLAPDDGNGGPMHIAEVDKGMLSANDIGTLAVVIGQIAAVSTSYGPVIIAGQGQMSIASLARS